VLRLLTFGSLSVHGVDGPLAGAAAQPRRLAVLVLVARGGKRGTTRAKLLGLLWPDADDEQGRRVVTQALYALRRDLGSDEAISGTQELRLNPEHVWCDAAEFDVALSSGDAAKAVELYHGPFLDGFRLSSAPEFERWADDERVALRHRMHAAVEGLARDADSRGAHGEAASWWRRRAADDPLNARVAIALMSALAAAGDRVGALRHAGVFEALMAEELELPPDREVIELAERLRREAHASPPPARPAAVEAPATTTPRAASGRTSPSVAVLPLALLGPNRAPEDYHGWSEELAEEIICALLPVADVRVLSRTASFALGVDPGLTHLRDELGASHAIEGSLRKTADGLRVTLRLIETAEGHAVSWERFDCVTEDAPAQERIAAQFAERVRATVTPK
jgi:DNA-binding SARP family transcriptional activator